MSYTEYIVDLANKVDKATKLAGELKGSPKVSAADLIQKFNDAGYGLSEEDSNLLQKNWENIHQMTSSQY